MIINSSWPSYTPDEVAAVNRVLLSNKVNYWTGGECALFEEEFASFANSKFAIAVSNGTVALELALLSLNLKKGDEVVVTPRTFIATVSAIVNTGAVPVFADVDLDSQNITAETIGKVLSPRTRGIVCVHLAGWPCNMEPILDLAKHRNLFVVEDCAQAHGARYQGKSVGSLGSVGCWSFCQDKIMTTGGEGGMVTTNDRELWLKMWSYKDHGKSYHKVFNEDHAPGFRWLHESFGTNWRMTEMQAAIGRIQLKKMRDWTTKRNANAQAIWETAAQLPGLRVPRFSCNRCSRDCHVSSNCCHAAYKCYVFVESGPQQRDLLIERITARGVPCYSGSCSEVYLEKAFDETGLRPSRRLPGARRLGDTALMFLCHPTLTENEINLTCEALRDSVHEVKLR